MAMVDIQGFLDFWKKQPDDGSSDPSTQRLYFGYQNTITRLAQLKSKTIEFIEPNKNGSGFSVDQDNADQFKQLAANIAEQRDLRDAREGAIKAYLELSNGEFVLTQLVNERGRMMKAIQSANVHASKLLEIEVYQNKCASIETIKSHPKIAEAFTKAADLEKENSPKIEALNVKLDKLRAIVESEGEGDLEELET